MLSSQVNWTLVNKTRLSRKTKKTSQLTESKDQAMRSKELPVRRHRSGKDCKNISAPSVISNFGQII